MRRAVASVVCAFALSAPAVAQAAGGPVPPVQGTPISLPGSTVGYTAVAAGFDTIVQRVHTAPPLVLGSRRIAGRFGIPGAAYDGSLTGLSADGTTLVLAQMPAGPPAQTSLVVLDAPRLVTREHVTLPGYDTVDAVSPDGRWIYLIHYADSSGTRYEVRAYDLATRQLLPEPIVDPHDRGEAMQGFPISRTMSPGGRWAYTLYFRPQGGDEPAFVHMLDTSGRRAVCVDLPASAVTDASSGRLALAAGGSQLVIEGAGPDPVTINTRTFAIERTPVLTPHAAPARPARAARQRSGGGLPLDLIVGGALLALALALTVRRRAAGGAATESTVEVGPTV